MPSIDEILNQTVSDPQEKQREEKETTDRIVFSEQDSTITYTPLRYRDREVILDASMRQALWSMNLPNQLGLLPPNIAWINEQHNAFITIDEPMMRRIAVRHATAPACECVWGRDDDGEEYQVEQCLLCEQGFTNDSIENHKGSSPGWNEYLLPLPWLTHVFSASVNTVELRQVLVSSEDPRLGVPMTGLPLPNVYADGTLCPGRTKLEQYADRYGRSDAFYLAGQAMESFWSSAFNYDVMHYKGHPAWIEIRNNVKMYWNDHHVFHAWEKLPLEEALALPWGSENEDYSGTGTVLEKIIRTFKMEKTLNEFQRTLHHTAMGNRYW